MNTLLFDGRMLSSPCTAGFYLAVVIVGCFVLFKVLGVDKIITIFVSTFMFEFTLGPLFLLDVLHLKAFKCVSYVRKSNRKRGLFVPEFAFVISFKGWDFLRRLSIALFLSAS